MPNATSHSLISERLQCPGVVGAPGGRAPCDQQRQPADQEVHETEGDQPATGRHLERGAVAGLFGLVDGLGCHCGSPSIASRRVMRRNRSRSAGRGVACVGDVPGADGCVPRRPRSSKERVRSCLNQGAKPTRPTSPRSDAETWGSGRTRSCSGWTTTPPSQPLGAGNPLMPATCVTHPVLGSPKEPPGSGATVNHEGRSQRGWCPLQQGARTTPGRPPQRDDVPGG
jgi:hypothetical protein